MISDAELLSLLCTILSKLDVGEFTIKVGFVAFFSLVSFIQFEISSIIEKSSMVYSKYVVSRQIKSAVSLRPLTNLTKLGFFYFALTFLIDSLLASLGRCEEGNDN